MGQRSYEVSRTINASTATIWGLLTNAESYAEWNESVISIEGPISAGNTIKLVSTLDPKRTFKLKVSDVQPMSRMIWADGMPLGLFKGERTFSISGPADGPCEFHMVEAYTGPLAGLITKAIPDMNDSFALFADGLKHAAEAVS